MKTFKLKRTFAIQISANKVKTYPAGRYSVPGDMPEEHASRAMQQHVGRYLESKAVPENKVVEAPETKTPVAKVRRRRARAKPDA